jgi:hypothetical protein
MPFTARGNMNQINHSAVPKWKEHVSISKMVKFQLLTVTAAEWQYIACNFTSL